MTPRLLPLLLWCVFLPTASIAQTYDTPPKSSFQLLLNTGFNTAKLRNENNDLGSKLRPFIGMSLVYRPTKNLGIKAAADYSIRALRMTAPVLTFANHYLDLTLAPQYRIWGDFYFQAGVVHSPILQSNYIALDGPTLLGLRRTRAEGFASETNILTGLEFRMQENVNFALNYSIPLSSDNISHVQLGISIALTTRRNRGKSYKRKSKETSREQIEQLQPNVLLVRLKTSEHKINGLINAGEDDRAAHVKMKQEAENLKIIQAFRKNFDFCEVQFFYSSHSAKIRQRQFDGVFLNDRLEVSDSIAISTNRPFFTAEFGNIEQGRKQRHLPPTDDDKVEGKVHSPPVPTGIGFHALRIMDAQFVQLNKPFPYFTRASHKTMRMHPEQAVFYTPASMAFLTWSYDGTVRRMNKRLRNYHKRAVRRS